MDAYDVIVIGSGIAGGFLARQLKLARPERQVLVLESAPVIDDYKVGESTVEVAANYMVRRLGLAVYLYQHQLPKNGLRFFFDSPEKDTPLTGMSEIGSDHLPFHPSFQLERAAFERDLVTLNRAAGVDVRLGAKVVDLEICRGTDHTVAWEVGGERKTARARWVCDASGRRQVLARRLGLPVHKEERLRTAAAWGRYRNVAGLDAVDDRAWRARVRNTSRHLSTNHLMYDGYWIWFIPLAGDLMSVGVVFDTERCADGPRSREELESFLGRHRAARELMVGAVFEDFRAYAHLPFHSDTYFSTDRWAVTGEAGAFTDPFYSPGSDFIATANELITALVAADSDGDATHFAEHTELCNAFYRLKYESNLALYARQYPIFGSFEVFRLKYLLDFHNYYNLIFWPFLADKTADAAWLREELEFAKLQLRAVGAFGEHFAKMGEALSARGHYHRSNLGRFANGLDGVAQLEPRLGPALDPKYRKAQLDRVYASVFAAIVESVLEVPGLSTRARVLTELSLPVVLALGRVDEACLSRLLLRVAARMTRELRAALPDAHIERVVLEAKTADRGREVRLDVVGPAEALRGQVLERARALWDEPGESLAATAGS